MKKLLLSFFVLVVFSFTTNVYSQVFSNGTGGGDWNTGTTWIGGLTPIATDNVVIQGSDVVTLAAAGTCANLQMNAGTTLSLNGSGLVIPGTSWNLHPTSTVIYNGTTTVQSAMTYGHLVYSTTANGTPNGNLIIAGDLTVNGNTLRGNSNTSGAYIHTISGNVFITGSSSRLACVTNTSATTASCTWNIAGNVSLSGNNSGNRIILYESAGPHSGSAIVNIDGNLIVGTSSRLEFKSSSSTSNNFPLGVINLKGNLIMNGNWNVSSVSAGTSPGFQFNFVGTSSQDWSGTPTYSVTGFDLNINVNNSAGVTLSAPLTISVSKIYLNLVQGNITTTSTNLLTIGTSGTLNGGSSSSFVSGPLRRIPNADGTYAYPVGKGAYSPVSLTLSGAAYSTANLDVEAFNVKHPQNSSVTDYLNRYWTIAANGITLGSYNADFIYDNADIAGTEGSLMLGKYDGSVWSVVGGVNAPANTLSGSSLASFSDFTGGEGSALPVELSSFIASAGKNGVMLKWVTNSETNNFGWEIEMRNSSQASWSKVGFVNGAGNSNLPKEYSFTHKPGQSGKFSYRLKQLDNDGSVSYSNEVEVNVQTPQTFSLAQNYPNPFNPSTNIDYTLPMDSKVTLAVYSLIGEKVADLVNQEQASGFYSYQLNTSNLKLTSGIYLYKLTAVSKTDEIFSKSMKMLLLK